MVIKVIVSLHKRKDFVGISSQCKAHTMGRMVGVNRSAGNTRKALQSQDHAAEPQCTCVNK